jgi:hypothetical protein
MRWRELLHGLTAGLLLGTILFFPFVPSAADHADGGGGVPQCEPIGKHEAARENSVGGENGNHADILVATPEPIEQGMARSVLAYDNVDSFAEIGWAHVIQQGHSDPTRFWHYEDTGRETKDNHDGDAGTSGTFHDYRLKNTSGTVWEFEADNTQRLVKEFTVMQGTLPYAQSESDSYCDWLGGNFKNLTDKNCQSCSWGNWSNLAIYQVEGDHPCFHVTLYPLENRFQVDHHDSSVNPDCV